MSELLPLFNSKYCQLCENLLPIADFHKDKNNVDGRVRECKKCVSQRQRSRRNNLSPQILEKGERRCAKCKENKLLKEFRMRSNKPCLQSYCRQCESKDATKWHKKNPERARELNRRTTLRRYYGISVEKYEELFNQQKGVCAICGLPETGKRRKYLCVDHDHKTNAIRGLLCTTCNFAIGYLRDDVSLLSKAIEYLETHSEKSSDDLLLINSNGR